MLDNYECTAFEVAYLKVCMCKNADVYDWTTTACFKWMKAYQSSSDVRGAVIFQGLGIGN